MMELKKYPLDFEKAYAYFVDVLHDVNELSIMLLKKINFSEGVFFTLLPENAAFDRLYNFKGGHMIPRKSCPRIVATGIHFKISQLIYDYIKNNNTIAILDHCIARSTDPHINVEGVTTLLSGDEVYYVLKNNNSQDQILRMLRKCAEVWHSLGVLTTIKEPLQTPFTGEDIESVCENATHLIIGAYDGEGYVLWEKKTLQGYEMM